MRIFARILFTIELVPISGHVGLQRINPSRFIEGVQPREADVGRQRQAEPHLRHDVHGAHDGGGGGGGSGGGEAADSRASPRAEDTAEVCTGHPEKVCISC